MFFVYVLFSLKDRMLYVGYTEEIKKRKQSHDSGAVLSTRDRRPLELIYYEAYMSKDEALRREKYLKGGNGRKILKIQLHETLKRLGYKHLGRKTNVS